MKSAPFLLTIIASYTAVPVPLRAQESYNVVVPPVESFRETFADNARGWPMHKSDTGMMAVTDGAYIHKAIMKETLTAKAAGADIRPQSNYYKLRVETKAMEGSGYYGLAFGIGNKANLNAFLINERGDYMVVERKDGVDKTLLSGKSAKINTGKGAVNVLSVETEKGYLGYQVSYCVNGSNVEIPTAAEQAIADAAKKATENKDETPTISDADFGAMLAGSLKPVGMGIGMLTKPGAMVAYDNMQLQVMANKGDITMHKNSWKFDRADAVYLKKSLLAEEEARLAERAQGDQKRAADAMAKAQKEIAALSTAQRTPPGAGGKTFSPDAAAVAWLRDILFQIENSDPFGFYQEKQQNSKSDNMTQYTIQHKLPGITGNAIGEIEKGKSATLMILLGRGLTEAQARDQAGQQLVNLCAAAGATTCQYLEADKTDPKLHMVRVYTGGKSILSGRSTSAVVIPRLDDNGTWNLRMYMKAE